MLIAKNILNIICLAKNNKINASANLFHETELIIKSSKTIDEKSLKTLYKIKKTYKIPTLNASEINKSTRISEDKGAIRSWDYLKNGIDYPSEKVQQGTSLVTCCMNRTENLIKALKSWIEIKEIDEIIIIDWSSKIPVKQSLDEENITSKKILVIRIENQPRWILSYAFNIGFRASKYDKILKTDADIIINPDFFNKNFLSKTEFIAGNWRKAPKGQEHVNGFFYIHRSNLMKVKGFNEHITTYGWDDDDIYSRMYSSGLKRVDVDLSSIYHIPHDDSLRIQQSKDNNNHLEALHLNPKFKIRFNRFIANAMPEWNAGRVFLPIQTKKLFENQLTAQKSGDSIHQVPTHIIDDAEYYAECELISWKAGIRSFELDRTNVRKLLRNKPIESINQLDLEVAIHNQSSSFKLSNIYLILSIAPSLAQANESELITTIEYLSKQCLSINTGLIIASDSRQAISNILPNDNSVGYVPGWRNLGQPKEITGNNILLNKEYSNTNQILILNKEIINAIKQQSTKDRAPPAISLPRAKFYVDAQHGLGNRLRAIGSAAAIAKATDRELIIIWEADHHCNCEFSDLFNYTGTVINKSIIKETKNQSNIDIYNYMEVEANAEKDKPINSANSKHIYGRAAYVFRHPSSNWESECAFMRTLNPALPVQQLMSEHKDIGDRIGIHIRMEAGKGLDNNTYDAEENWTQEGHDQLHYWRDKSHYSVFIKHIDKIMASDPKAKLFLATDLPETYKIFENYYTHKITYLKRNVFDRSKEQIIYALADALLLSKCNQLMGSTWSSFSELAMRLSTSYTKIEMSGKDF